MELEATGFDAFILGDGPTRSYRAKVTAHFRDQTNDRYCHVEVDVFVAARADATFDEMKQEAIDAAVPVLRAAIEQLTSKSVAEAKEEQWRQEEDQRRQRAP